jgi:hypothetical protein
MAMTTLYFWCLDDGRLLVTREAAGRPPLAVGRVKGPAPVEPPGGPVYWSEYGAWREQLNAAGFTFRVGEQCWDGTEVTADVGEDEWRRTRVRVVVGPAVGNVRNDVPGLVAPAADLFTA